MADYARMKVALERSEEPPEKALQTLDIRMGEWMRLERHHTAAADRDSGAKLNAAISAARTAEPTSP